MVAAAPVIHRFRWRLAYRGRDPFDEEIEGSSVLDAPKNPAGLVIVDWVGNKERPLVRIHLDDDGGGWKPILYRIRHQDRLTVRAADGTESAMNSPTETDAMVFGRGRDGSIIGDAQLWTVTQTGTVIDCPQRAIRQGMIQHLLEG